MWSGVWVALSVAVADPSLPSPSLASPASPASLSVDVVPAVGNQTAVLRVQRSGMVRMAVQAPSGTMCTLVDHLRGPFVSSGVVGKENCSLDVLLDEGQYKVRLTSPSAAPSLTPSSSKTTVLTSSVPQARLSASLFSDVDAPQQLEPGRSSVVSLPSGQQVTRWLRVRERQEVVLEVAGRTAGKIGLWRDGQWLLPLAAESSVLRPVTGRPLWRHELKTVLDPGDYALVVYGTQAQRFTTGDDDDTVFVGFDAPPTSPSRSDALVVPAWGFASLRAPKGKLAAFIHVEGARTEPVTLWATSVVQRSEGQLRTDSERCVIDTKALRSSCVVFIDGDTRGVATILRVEASPGTVARVVWAPWGDQAGDFVPGRSDTVLTPRAAFDRVTLSTLPTVVDEVPLGCALDQLDDALAVKATVAHDLPHVGWTEAFQSSFNSRGTSSTVWLHIDRAGLYTITGDDATGASCEVFRLGDGGETERLGAGTDGKCRQRIALSAGPVAIRFYGGKPGIQTLRVGTTGLSTLVGNDAAAASKRGCILSSASPLPPGNYRLRTNGDAQGELHSVVVSSGPWRDVPLTLPLDPGRTLSLPMASGAGVAVRVVGTGSVTCALDGKPLTGCTVDVLTASATLTLTAPAHATPGVVLISRVSPPSSSPPLSLWRAAPPQLTAVTAGKTVWFDLMDDAARFFVVDVAQPGLYTLQTEGLLQTRCAVQTSTSTNLFSGSANGRGHNCLVQGYLKAGRYLVQVTRNGRSRGRAGLSLLPRAAWEGGDLVVGDERYVQVAADTLAQHRFTLAADTSLHGQISAQGATLRCRLDDDDGWPLKTVPHPCTFDGEELPAGRYTWSVLPLTVESRRVLHLGKKSPEAVLVGDKPHTLSLNKTYRAVLSPDGSDEFRFTLAGAADVGVVLGEGMIGRLSRLSASDAHEASDVVATILGPRRATPAYDDVGEDGPIDESVDEGFDEGTSDVETFASQGETDSLSEDAAQATWLSEASSNAVPSVTEADRLLRATVHQPAGEPSGQVVSLGAGTWVLRTESQTGDVAVGYDVRLDVRALLPGVTLAVMAPATVAVVPPSWSSSGLVRLRTRGATDVACRLLDGNQNVIAKSEGSGADWNCALTAPLVEGQPYELLVDAEVLQPGPTTLIAEFLEAKDTGVVKDGDAFRVKGKVAKATVKPVRGEVTDLTLASMDSFSCAAFDADGTLLDRQLGVTRCSLQLWPGATDTPFTVMAWTEDRPASLKAQLAQRQVRRSGGLLGAVADDRTVVEVPLTGRGVMATAPDARCIARKTRGALVPCAEQASFDPARDGDSVLLSVPRGASATIRGAEVVAEVGANKSFVADRVVTSSVFFERARAEQPVLHIATVQAVAGSANAPQCALEGGVRVVDASSCTAATGPQDSSMLSLWTKPGGQVTARVKRAVVPLAAPRPLPPGAGAGSGGGAVLVDGVARYALPTEPFLLEIALAPEALVLQLDAQEKAVDVCAPSSSLSQLSSSSSSSLGKLARCVLQGRGGSVVVVGGATPFAARFDVWRMATAQSAVRSLAGLYEASPRMAGHERLRFSATAGLRELFVEGPGVLACVVHLDDGTRISSCTAEVASGQSGELWVKHDARPFRAALGDRGATAAVRLGTSLSSLSSPPPPSVPPQPPERVEPLSGSVVYRAATTRGAGVLRLLATDGVCGVERVVARDTQVVASEGTGDGCDLSVVVDSDSAWRLVVRGFAGAPLSGTVAWTFSQALVLHEGVGPAVYVQPGEARAFRLDLTADGELGIGVQSDADVLECVLLDAATRVVEDGCQQFGRRALGTYWLRVRAPLNAGPRSFRPVVFGLKGAEIDVPDSFLRDFFRRVQASSQATPAEAP
jgi:hypothetical protein